MNRTLKNGDTRNINVDLGQGNDVGVTYSSSNSSIVTVNASGLITVIQDVVNEITVYITAKDTTGSTVGVFEFNIVPSAKADRVIKRSVKLTPSVTGSYADDAISYSFANGDLSGTIYDPLAGINRPFTGFLIKATFNAEGHHSFDGTNATSANGVIYRTALPGATITIEVFPYAVDQTQSAIVSPTPQATYSFTA